MSREKSDPLTQGGIEQAEAERQVAEQQRASAEQQRLVSDAYSGEKDQ